MNFTTICVQYDLGQFLSATPLKPGTVAQVWRLETSKGSFLLRTLTGKEQGGLEWTIARHLTARGFRSFPGILTAADEAPMMEMNGTWYQVQEFRTGAMPSPGRPGTSGKVAELVVRLTQTLADCPAVSGAPDRFELSTVWKAHRQNWPQLELPLSPEEADRRVAELTALPAVCSQIIHGDLGLWNMLETGDGIWVIDFGEARLGDPYFDLASALGGLINHSDPARRREHAAEFLRRCRDMTELDLERLAHQLRLWVWRGLAQCVRSPESWKKMAQRFYNALIWAEENLHEL